MTTMSPMVRTAATVGDMLGRVHEKWMEQVITFLTPALNDEADFWTRWPVARFLSDQFRGQFLLERALLDALGPLVPDEASRTLASVRAGLEQTVESWRSWPVGARPDSSPRGSSVGSSTNWPSGTSRWSSRRTGSRRMTSRRRRPGC